MLHFHPDDNRRIGHRIHANAPIKVAIQNKHFWDFLFQRTFSATLADISVQGMQLATDRPIPSGTILKLWVPVEYKMKTYNLILRGEVMWSKPGLEKRAYLAGLKLMDFSSPAMQIWAASTLDEIRDFEH
jgi:hypothetical protein